MMKSYNRPGELLIKIFGDGNTEQDFFKGLKRPPAIPMPEIEASSVEEQPKRLRTELVRTHWTHVVRNIDVMSWKEDIEAKRDWC